MKTTSETELIDEIEDVVSDLIKSVVRNPDGAKVTKLHRGQLLALAIRVDQEDVRRVIGQRGKHFKAVETIVREAARVAGLEGHVAIDEKSPPTSAVDQPKSFALGQYSAKKFKNVKELLRRSVMLVVANKSAVAVTETPMATTTFLEIKVKKEDYPALYGKDAPFDYGTDGHIIGALKNFFDAIGKNNGRVIKIIVQQV
jgi:predicted RNA-binding protein YlqC (UPF0109 family)